MLGNSVASRILQALFGDEVFKDDVHAAHAQPREAGDILRNFNLDLFGLLGDVDAVGDIHLHLHIHRVVFLILAHVDPLKPFAAVSSQEHVEEVTAHQGHSFNARQTLHNNRLKDPILDIAHKYRLRQLKFFCIYLPSHKTPPTPSEESSYQKKSIYEMLEGMLTATYLFVWIAMGSLSAYLAKKRGKNPLFWFVLGALLGVLGIFALFFMPAMRKTAPHKKGEEGKETIDITPNIPKSQLENFWYYLQSDNTREGPMSFDALKRAYQEGKIARTTYVWNDEMEGWKHFGEVLS